MLRHLLFVLALVAFALSGGCGDPIGPPPMATTITISPVAVALEDIGDIVQLTATVRDQNGQAMTAVEVTWVSSDWFTAQVSEYGLVRGVESGTATVKAHVDTLAAAATITVELGPRAVLHTVYREMGGEGWEDNTNWKTDAPLDEWYGVSTDVHGNITSLQLARNWLTGAIPPELGKLKRLRSLSLYLHRNELTGPIPPELRNLTELENLDLEWNDLTGPIPPELGNLQHLRILGLSRLQLSGPIPPELGDLQHLNALRLWATQLSGPIPLELGNLDNLEDLHLGSNDFSGPIPPELGNLRDLERLILSQNHQLSGRLPAELIGIPLRTFWWTSTDLCAPPDEAFQEWLSSIRYHSGRGDCESGDPAIAPSS